MKYNMRNDNYNYHGQPFGKGTIIVEQRGQILLIALNRPEAGNAFSDDMYRDLTAILKKSKDSEDISAVVITGSGSFFSSGADIKQVVKNFKGDRVTLQLPVGQFMMAVIDFPKILAAAVNGPCIGIATTLLFHCDLCFCSKNATFWAPFTRLALVPEFCSSITFQSTMGLAKANELLLLGRKIDAQTAVEWNICSRILPYESTNAFEQHSLGSQVCEIIQNELLSLPLGSVTAETFVKLVRRPKRVLLRDACYKELERLDQRFNRGDVMDALNNLSIGSKNKQISNL